MRRSQAFPSQYVGKDDVTTPIIVTIRDVRIDRIKGEHGEEEKPVMIFAEPNMKAWIINTTNWMTIEGAYGEDSDDWNGRQIELYHDPNVMFGKDRVGGVRCRIPAINRSAPQSSGPTFGTCLIAAKQRYPVEEEAKSHVLSIAKEAYPDARNTKELTPAMWQEVLNRINAAPVVEEEEIPF